MRGRGGVGNREVVRMGWRKALQELLWTLADVVECGDLLGHLVCWWQVVRGAEASYG